MRLPTYLLSAAILLFGAVTAFAQPANFAGHWVQEVLAGTRAGPPPDGGGAPPGGPPRGGAAGNPQGAGMFGGDFWMVQDAKTLSVKRLDTQTGDTLSGSYNLDGSESKNRALFGGGSTPTQTISTIKWDGKKLVITTAGVGGGGDIGGNTGGPTTTVLFMSGKQLRVETNRVGANGVGGASILTFYNKKK